MIIRQIVYFICLLAFLLSFDSTAAEPAKPKVVRKKIVVQTEKKTPTGKTAAVRPTESRPAVRNRSARTSQKTQEPVSKPETAPVQKPQATDKTLVAKKTDTVERPKPTSGRSNGKKPAINSNCFI